MFEQQQFIKPVYKAADVPADGIPALIICGRSNVGKSSFINSLFNRKELAKTSSTPGKTRSINFYLIDQKFYMVDLPGIGYARTSKSESKALGTLISEFISGYENLRHVFHLIDSRHKPTSQDLLLDELLIDNNRDFSIILTKSDKLNQAGLSEARKNILQYYPGKKLNDSTFFYSSLKGTGRKEVSRKIFSLFYLKSPEKQ